MPPPASKHHVRCWGMLINMKRLSLFLLVLQNTANVLTIKHSRVGVRGPAYLATTAVAVAEVVKIAVCCVVIFFQQGGSLARLARVLHYYTLGNPKDALKVAVPAGLYAVQNNLLYVAVQNLTPGVFQVTYQLKIVTTALFTVAILGRKLTALKWTALVVLLVGAALVQLDKVDPSDDAAAGLGGGVDAVPVYPTVGLIAALSATVTSGFASVYFEKILKRGTKAGPPPKGKGGKAGESQKLLGANGAPKPCPATTAPVSLWIRNVQLGSFGFLVAMAGVYSQDGDAVARDGFFQGYSPLVWTVIGIQSGGGLLVAVVMKYADNILKGFATSVSIILSSVLSVYLFDVSLSLVFLLGALLVSLAVVVYGNDAAVARRLTRWIARKDPGALSPPAGPDSGGASVVKRGGDELRKREGSWGDKMKV